MEKELEILDALVKHATEGILISDLKGQIIMANPKVERQFAYEQGGLIGKNIDTLVPDRFSHHHEKKREGFAQSPQPRSMGIGIDLYAKRKNGTEFPVEISLSNFKTSEGSFIMSFIIDITQRKLHEAQIEKANEEIRRLYWDMEKRIAERTEELAMTINELASSKQETMRALETEKELNTLKSRFITTASHEFRTPLAAILSSASLISKYDNAEDLEKRHKHVSKIKSAVSNLTEILNDFLSLSKLEEGVVRNNPVEFNLHDFARELTEEMKTTAKDKQKIHYIHVGNDTEVELDKQLLKNVMINLLSNAIKYSPEGEDIHFTTECNIGSVIINVKDRGIGIPAEDQPHLFERFFRANNSANIEGTGLGLNIVRKYIELMDGEMSFVSALNQGTTFTITLPR